MTARTITLSLGGVDYPVAQLPVRRAAHWRGQLKAALGDVAQVLPQLGQLEIPASAADVQTMLRSGQLDQTITTLTPLLNLLIDGPATALDLIYAYAPNIADDHERVEATTYDDEVLTALVAIVRLAFPLAQMAGAVRATGQAARQN